MNTYCNKRGLLTLTSLPMGQQLTEKIVFCEQECHRQYLILLIQLLYVPIYCSYPVEICEFFFKKIYTFTLFFASVQYLPS